jgi:hypothetical protein
VLQLGEEALDQVTLAVEPLAEAGFPTPIALRRDVRSGALLLDQRAHAVGIIGLVRQHDRARAELIEQRVGDLPIVRLPSGQAEPDREALRIDERMDLGREAASGATETMICIPLFCRRGLLVSANGGAVDHLDVAVVGGGEGLHHPLPDTRLPPSHEAIVAGGARAVTLGQVAPWRTGSQHPEDAVQHAPIVDARYASWFVGQQRLDHTPLEVGQVISAHSEPESESGARWKLQSGYRPICGHLDG